MMRRVVLPLSLGLASLVSTIGACGDEADSCDCDAVGCAASGCAKTVFVTAQTYPANFGGLAQADAYCQDAAVKAGLGGTYYAWLSTSASEPLDRFSKAAVPYELPDGRTLAADWNTLVSSGPALPINVDASGVPVDDPSMNRTVWTNTGRDGRAETYSKASAFCSDWTANAADDNAVVGWLTKRSQPDDWTFAVVNPCTGSAHLYCFQQ